MEEKERIRKLIGLILEAQRILDKVFNLAARNGESSLVHDIQDKLACIVANNSDEQDRLDKERKG